MSKAAAFIVPTRFTAVDGVSDTVKVMKRNVAGWSAAMEVGVARQERLFRKLSPSIGDAAKNLIKYGAATAAIMGAGFTAKSIEDYEAAIQSLQAVTMVSNKELGIMKEQVETLANKTKKSAIDVAGSFEVIGSAMSQYLQDPKALTEISQAGIMLAKASRTKLVPTLQNLTSIMNQFNLTAEKSVDTVNRLTAGEIVGSLRTAQVAESLQEFGAGAYTANVSLAESVALVEALGKQLKQDKIGVAARNILIIMDSAKGLSKQARRLLRSTGVDMSVLMDRTRSLGDRLKELSKVQKNQTAAVKIFGHENVTAAQVIFNQLGTYEEYLRKIKVTNAAHEQAEINSRTFAVAIDELKNSFLNYIVTGNGTTSMLMKAGDAVRFVTNNLDTIITVGTNVLKFYALWKGAILAAKGASMLLSGAIVVQNAVSNALFLVDMVKYVAITQGMTKATAALAIAQESLNVAFAANPVGFMIGGILALGTAIYFLNKHHEKSIDDYKKWQDLKISDAVKKEREEVDRLTQSYQNMGYTLMKSRSEALKVKRFEASEEVSKLKSEKERLKNEAVDRANQNTFNPFFSQSENRELFDEKSKELTKAMRVLNENTNLILRASSAGIINKSTADSLLLNNSNTPPSGLKETPQMLEQKKQGWLSPEKQWKPENQRLLSDEDLTRLKNALKVQIEFKNAPAGTTATVSGTGLQTSNSY